MTTMSLRKPGKASPTQASRSRFLLYARVSAPSVALEVIVEGRVVCGKLWSRSFLGRSFLRECFGSELTSLICLNLALTRRRATGVPVVASGVCATGVCGARGVRYASRAN